MSIHIFSGAMDYLLLIAAQLHPFVIAIKCPTGSAVPHSVTLSQKNADLIFKASGQSTTIPHEATLCLSSVLHSPAGTSECCWISQSAELVVSSHDAESIIANNGSSDKIASVANFALAKHEQSLSNCKQCNNSRTCQARRVDSEWAQQSTSTKCTGEFVWGWWVSGRDSNQVHCLCTKRNV